MSANDRQEGGSHYKRFQKMQPWDIITYFSLGYLDGTAVKYLLRWRVKHKDRAEQLVDLKKARHYIDKLIEEVNRADDDTKF